MKKIKSIDKNLILIAFSVLIVHTVIWMFSGNSPLSDNPYNSYLLQAQAWRDGSFDLGRGYSHLELAEYDYRFFVSFPPFPSVVYFPFVMLGIPVFEGVFAFAFAVGGAIMTYVLLKGEGVNEKRAVMYTLLFTCGSNLLFVSIDAWVWFIAQNMCYALTVTAIYFAVKKKGFFAFLSWAFAVGCRPFQVMYFPLLCMLMCRNDKKKLFKNYWQYSGAAVVAVFYMWLNWSRFGNIFEFGHNYLPEFVNSENGQFSLKYLATNLYSLVRLPSVGENGALKMQRFDGMNVLLVSPVYALAVFNCFKKNKNGSIKLAALLLAAAEIVLICCHKTMGGWQFGNRYTNDCLPFALTVIALSDRKQNGGEILSLITLYGIAFNTVGTVLCNLNAL